MGKELWGKSKKGGNGAGEGLTKDDLEKGFLGE